MSEAPDFRNEAFLREHVRGTLAFYHPRAIDPAGGFYQYFRDDGDICDASRRHLVSSARFVFNYAMAYREFGGAAYLRASRHGLRYLREVHRDADTGGYAWTVRDGAPEDRTNHCYGAAFVLLAYAVACAAGIEESAAWLEETRGLLETRFWDPAAGLYRDEADPAWRFTAYRGQNANMHLCEALIAAFEATGDGWYLERALLLADNVTRRLAAKSGGLVWEHYDEHWRIDWDYNREDPRHLFRPWGFQAGHQTEWAKLLLMLDRHANRDWLVPKARLLFGAAMEKAWDGTNGGIAYGFAPDGSVCDADRYFWVQAETLAAAAVFAERTGERGWWEWYERVWAYAWRHFVDHEHGAWYRILDRDNRRYDDLKSPAGKTDYHTMGACYEALRVLRGTGA